LFIRLLTKNAPLRRTVPLSLGADHLSIRPPRTRERSANHVAALLFWTSFPIHVHVHDHLLPAWDHVALRKRYDSSYQEYMAVFSLIIAQKSQIKSLLKSDSDSEDGVELL
jgi:hypothetical protein